MYRCNKCNGFYDAREIRGSTCVDCIEEEKQLEIRKEWNRKMLAKNVIEQRDGQLIIGGLRD